MHTVKDGNDAKLHLWQNLEYYFAYIVYSFIFIDMIAIVTSGY